MQASVLENNCKTNAILCVSNNGIIVTEEREKAFSLN